MEEILASIKRVIREDGRVPGASAQPRAPRRTLRDVAPAEDDVLELNEPVAEVGTDEMLASEDTTLASREALAALSTLRHRETPSPVASAAGNGALEAVVREMLRPMIKDWLDENLPGLVEELVTREISRIVGRR